MWEGQASPERIERSGKMSVLSSAVFELAVPVQSEKAVAVLVVGSVGGSQCTAAAVAGFENLAVGLGVDSLYSVAVTVGFQSQWLEERDRVAVGLPGNLRTIAARAEAAQDEHCCRRQDRNSSWNTFFVQLPVDQKRLEGG